MPIRRPRTPKPTLRHIAFLEMLADTRETSPLRPGAHAAFLTLRLLDSWVKLGAPLADPGAQAHAAAREAVGALQADPELRGALGVILDAVEALQEPDVQPVLPRVYALGLLLEQRGLLAQAADVYQTVTRHVDSAAHLDLAYDAFMRTGYCLRHVGEFEWADQAYGNAGALATRDRDRIRVILARLGRAKVLWDRGNLPAADDAISELLVEAETIDSNVVTALLLHDRASLAWMRGDRVNAMKWLFRGYTLSPDDYDRERMLVDLAGYLSQFGAFDSARDALRVIEKSARAQGTRWVAQINMLDLAYRTRNEVMFETYRRDLADQPLPPVNRVSYLLDVGKGCTVFGQYAEGRAALTECMRLARVHGLNRRLIQAEEALAALNAAEATRAPAPAMEPIEAPEEIADALRRLLAEVTAGA